ncbi:MAG: hypothetical protein O7E52_25070 [Candidatus Poribacteria bacterium]|nr:hypothetical protein [Candidatus Poribacteria bacterium]
MRRGKTNVFAITETEDQVESAPIEQQTESEAEFQLERLQQVQGLREDLDHLTQVQIDLVQMMQAFQMTIEQKLDAILQQSEGGR